MKRRSVLALAGAPWVASCGPSTTSGPRARTLRFWAMGGEASNVIKLLPAFERERPGLKVVVDQIPFTTAHEKLLTAFAGDATPDVTQLGNTWIPELVALNALEPESLPSVKPEDYFEGIWATNVLAGQTWGVPWYVDTRLLFYRRDLFARAGLDGMPQTWPAFDAALTALQQKAGVAHPLLLPLNEFEPLLAFCLQQPDSLLRDGDRFGNFRGAGFRTAMAFYLSQFKSGHAPPLTNNEIANVYQEFGRGSFAVYLSGPWNIGEFDKRLGPNRKQDWTTAPLPGPTGPGASTAGGASLVVFRRSKLKDDALALIDYLSRPAVQLLFHALTGDLPPRHSAWAMRVDGQPPLAEEPRAIAFAEQLKRVRPTPAVPEWERIVNEMQLAANRAVQAGVSIDETAKSLDARVDGFLEKRRWMLAQAARRGA